ncbi:GUN4 domain-containing protein [Nostoc sp.]|uniref:GUN4 domain-containing protein n=1 Tax=Nostoc sp. TaxID=1180 RepID=UPI002FF960DA
MIFDYTRLKDLLKTGLWKEAHQETFTIMLTIADCEAKQYLDVEDIQKFPYEDLKTIDNLWKTHSNSRVLLKVQLIPILLG